MIVHEWFTETTSVVDRGAEFGARWSSQLQHARDDYLRLFIQSGVPEAAARRTAKECFDAVAALAPEVAEEYRGMARGSGLPLPDLHLLAARTEILAGVTTSQECSTIVHVPHDARAPHTLQTWDWHQTLSNETIVQQFRSSTGSRITIFCEFGQPAKIGVNEHGVGLHFNILHHESDGSRVGVPVHVLARMILDRARTLEDAVSIARSTPLAASTVLTVVSFDGTTPRAAAIEVSPVGIAVLPVDRGSTFAHTNHFLDAALAAGEHCPYETSSVPRYRCLTDAAALAEIAGDRDRALAFGAIPAAPISVRPVPEEPEHLRWETKLTIALDVAAGAIAFAPAAPADIQQSQWRRVGAE